MTKDEALDQQLSGIFFAYDLILNFLLKDYIARNADTGSDTEHLEALFRDVRDAFDSRRSAMSDLADHTAQQKVNSLLAMSLDKYREFRGGSAS